MVAWAMVLAIIVFPQAIGSNQHEVAGLGEEVQRQGDLDQGAVDLVGPVPVEVSHRFEPAEAGLSEAAFEAATSEFLGFRGGDFFQ